MTAVNVYSVDRLQYMQTGGDIGIGVPSPFSNEHESILM